MKDITTTLLKRTSVRRYERQPIEEEKLKLIYEAIANSPTSYNGQQYSVIAIDDQTMKEKLYELTDSKAADMIQKTDKRRASYYNYYSSKKWGEAKSYDLCIDSGELGIDGCIELIIKYIELKEKNFDK